jgi:hypothetical protein
MIDIDLSCELSARPARPGIEKRRHSNPAPNRLQQF